MKRSILSISLALILVSVLLPFGLAAQDSQSASVQQQLLGTWRLASFIRQEVGTGAISDVMGPNPSGYINYGPDGRVMVIIASGGRNKPATGVPSSAEAEALVKTMVSYAGTYSIDTKAKTVTHLVDISWNQSYTGTKQIRNYRFEAGKLYLETVPSPDPVTGKTTVRSLIWERMK